MEVACYLEGHRNIFLNLKRKKVLRNVFGAVPNSAISGQMGMERCGHDLEPLQTRQSL